ncbi:hypothetical protein J5N97_001706 [Dioscorea zingiberensis]|uniref:Uncharacterized protein n=1 Tax=Dioscorea zingiberensis TaxID=325984 RepID=A0A9D5H354_9LILI|nr:hypothetical protein J5N97_001706 [Dioscorea zingiberensis]
MGTQAKDGKGWGGGSTDHVDSSRRLTRLCPKQYISSTNQISVKVWEKTINFLIHKFVCRDLCLSLAKLHFFL